ncbi:MAG TPA: methyltransferase domain-containing protein [Mycobacteriales bacterium]|nr:methyltransferase domain-containing protein [Mycobacteriales bacterium]
MPSPSSAAFRRLLGIDGHPGGPASTRAAAAAAGVTSGTLLLDVGAGDGTTAALLARELGVRVVGVELGARSAAAARRSGVHVVRGDALELPVPDAAYDVVLCQLTLSAVAAPDRVVAEMARALRPGGRLVICDVVAELDLRRRHPRVDRAVRRLLTPLPVVGYADLVARARLAMVSEESRSADLLTMTRQVERRLSPVAVVPGIRAMRDVARECRAAIAEGSLGYVVLVARKP